MPHAEHARAAPSLPRPEWLVPASLRQTTTTSFLRIGWPPGPDPAAEAALVELTQLAAIGGCIVFSTKELESRPGCVAIRNETPLRPTRNRSLHTYNILASSCLPSDARELLESCGFIVFGMFMLGCYRTPHSRASCDTPPKSFQVPQSLPLGTRYSRPSDNRSWTQ